MDIGAILLTAAAAVLVGFFISRPFFDRRFEAQPLLARQAAARSEHDASALLAEKDHILNQLLDLDFDLQMGKLSAAEHAALRGELLSAGAAVLRKLDEEGLGGRAVRPAAVKSSSVKSTPPSSGDEIERLIAERRQQMRRAAEGQPGTPAADAQAAFCPKCGRPTLKGDQFCPKCGAALVE